MALATVDRLQADGIDTLMEDSAKRYVLGQSAPDFEPSETLRAAKKRSKAG